MANGATTDVLRQVGRLFGEGTIAGLTDRQLLDRFRSRQDEAAFEAIVARHGPMVLGVCRDVLRDPADADDAFQAAFLVLLRRVDSIRGRDGVGGWLYRVSYRIALRARRAAARRGGEPTTSEPLAPDNPPADAMARELRSLIRRELDSLPESYRAPIVLCDLEGLTHDEAASRLCWPVGTVKGRLSRGREKLRDRLTRRGVTAPAAIVGAVLSAESARAAVPAALIRSTVAVALAVKTSGAVPVAVGYLVDGALRAMFWKKVGLVVGALVAVGSIAGGVAAVGDGDLVAERDPTEPSAPDDQRAGSGELAPAAKLGGPSDLAGERAAIDLAEVELEAEKRTLAKLLADYAEQEEALHAAQAVPQDERVLHSMKTGLNLLGRRIDERKARYVQRSAELAERKQRLADSTRTGGPGPGSVPLAPPRAIEPGDVLVIEVLEGLPGRPITGKQRVVRPDGTISLEFYGDLLVAGLTRTEIKEKIIQHFRRFLTDEALGLVDEDPKTGERRAIPPAESDRISVDDSINFLSAADRDEALGDIQATRRRTPDRLQSVEMKLDMILQRLGPIEGKK